MDDLWECGKYCEELSWNHRTAISHRLETRNCRTSCTSSKRRDISRVIAIWMEWRMKVRFHEMLLLSVRCPKPTGKREISDIERRSGESFKGSIILFVALIGYLPELRERQSKSSSIGKKLSRGILLVMLYSRSVNLGRRYSDHWYWRIGKFGVMKYISEDWILKRSW